MRAVPQAIDKFEIMAITLALISALSIGYGAVKHPNQARQF
jgi:hypothetical protein